MKFFGSSDIILERVDLGDIKISLPISVIKGKTPGPIVVITAGMDGDEYTGIQAAYQSIDWYLKQDFPGQLIIIPIVNIPGFFAGKSLNPEDNKYPKYVFPGSSNGSSTQRLIDWLDKKYLTNASLWLDLHSGAITETLNPFIWAHQTGNTTLNNISQKILSNLDSSIKIYQKKSVFSKQEKLAKRNCIYFVFESGQKGEQNSDDINREVTWVKQALEAFWYPDTITKKLTDYYQRVTFYQSKKSGLWKLKSSSQKSLSKGEIVGAIYGLNQYKLDEIKVKEEGVLLWAKSALFVQPGDELLAVASY